LHGLDWFHTSSHGLGWAGLVSYQFIWQFLMTIIMQFDFSCSMDISLSKLCISFTHKTWYAKVIYYEMIAKAKLMPDGETKANTIISVLNWYIFHSKGLIKYNKEK
jgi:hypothetical protein